MRIDDEIQGELRGLQLTSYELRVFAAANESGASAASMLAKRARIPRSSVYPVLETLIRKGLISTEQRKGANVFIPASPDALVSLAEERLEEAKAGLEASRRVAKILESSRGRDALSSAKILIVEGERSVSKFLYDHDDDWRQSVIDKRTSWIGFQDETFLHYYGEWVVDYWRRSHNRRDRAQDTLKLFATQDAIGKQIAKRTAPFAEERREFKPMPKNLPFTATLWVMGVYVVVLKTRTKPHYGLQIRDSVLAENLALIFNAMWELTASSTHPEK